MRKLVLLVMFLAMVLGASGCAVQKYDKYADAQRAVYQAQVAGKTALVAALAQAAQNTTGEARGVLIAAIMAATMQNHSMRLEMPKESPIERGLSSLLSAGLPMVGLAHVVADGIGEATGTTTYNQTSTGGSSAVVMDGPGIIHANPATSPPTVVTQPDPVIVGVE